jgi:hypothetical protein
MTDMRASPTLTDTPEHVAAVLAHPAVVLLPAAVIERIARIADGDNAHDDDVLLRQVTLIPLHDRDRHQQRGCPRRRTPLRWSATGSGIELATKPSVSDALVHACPQAGNPSFRAARPGR